MIKTKILIANDASILGTGYGVYGKELLKRLNATGKYEIAELACYADINTPGIKDYEWKVYPNAVGPQHKDWESYRKTSVSAFGGWRFNKVAIHFQPDIVFDIRDYWMYAYQEVDRKSVV